MLFWVSFFLQIARKSILMESKLAAKCCSGWAIYSLLIQSKESKTENKSFEIAKGKLSSYKNLKLASCTNPKLSSYKNPKLTSYKDLKLTFICWSGRHPLISPIWQTMQKSMVSHDKCVLLLTLILNESTRIVDRLTHNQFKKSCCQVIVVTRYF